MQKQHSQRLAEAGSQSCGSSCPRYALGYAPPGVLVSKTGSSYKGCGSEYYL